MATESFHGVEEQPALFDDDLITHTLRDSRTVGEMLIDVDHTARTLLIDVTADDAGALLHGWPAIVAAAADLWDSLPGPRMGPEADDRDEAINRLSSMATAIDNSLTTTHWPQPGPPDARLVETAHTLGRAARLVRKYGNEVEVEKPHVRGDLVAVRTRIMHGVYLTAHAVGVSLIQYGRECARDAAAARRPLQPPVGQTPHAVEPTTAWVRRVAASESVAGSYLIGRIPHDFTGAGTAPIEEGRLGRALARWDIQAHRTLATNPTAANLVVITRTQGLIAAGGVLPVIAAGRHVGIFDDAGRLEAATATSVRAWNNLGSRWGDLAHPTDRVDPQLATAAAELRAVFRELTHDTTASATPEIAVARPELERAVSSALSHLDGAPELAYVVAEKAEAPGLTGPARALSIRAHNDAEGGHTTHPATEDVVWVLPSDIHARRTIPLPTPVRAGLLAGSAATVEAAATGTSPSAHALGDMRVEPRPTTPTARNHEHARQLPVGASRQQGERMPR